MGLTTPIIVVVFAVILLLRTVRVVPQQNAFVVERLGKYNRTMNAGLHVVVPFVDVIRFKHNLREVVLDIPEQVCITRDNVQVTVDGIIFFRVVDPAKASYGVSSFIPAIVQLAQTTLRSEIGKLELDRTFEERQHINNEIVLEIDKATDPWGVKVLRYEIKSITPPQDVIAAMEKQMRAEREKRAKILESEGDRDSKVNRAEGDKQQVIKNSEASRQQQINEAEGRAAAIFAVAKATSDGLNLVASVLAGPGGQDAARLRVAEEYVKQFGELAKKSNTMIVPASASEMSGMIATAMSVFDKLRPSPEPTQL